MRPSVLVPSLLLVPCLAVLLSAGPRAQDREASPEFSGEAAEQVVEKAEKLFEAGDFKTAADFAGGMIERGALDPPLHQIRGWARLELSDPAGALGDFDRAKELGEDSPFLDMDRGFAFLALKEPFRASAAFGEAARGGVGDAHLWEGIALMEMNRPREAEEAFDRMEALGLTDRAMYRWRAAAKARTGRRLEAAADLLREQWVRFRPRAAAKPAEKAAANPDRCRPLGLFAE